jgi:fatty acid desaturase
MAIDVDPHDALVASMTGGMQPVGERPFAGSELLRPDGRPRPELRAELRRIPNARNAITTFTIMAAPLLVTGLVLQTTAWWAVALAMPVMGNIQTRMYILHHEASHRLLFSKRRANDLIGVNLVGWFPFGTGTHHYRRGHANHHRDEFGPNEPDFLLYSFYPIAKASFLRKLRRDATGVSAYRMLRPRFTGLFKKKYLGLSLRFFAGQAIVIALFVATGRPWLYVWLWMLPYLTWYQVQNRLRSIAEHAGMTRSSDRRDTTHHVEQNLPARILMAPYGVGYHLAHHVDSGVPFRNLKRLHEVLEEDGYLEGASTWPSYTALWRELIVP